MARRLCKSSGTAWYADMNIPCENEGVLCVSSQGTPVDPSNPQGNFSSEAADVNLRFGTNYGVGYFPPLGSRWYAFGCIGIASGATQEEADLAAARQAVLCRSNDWPVETPNPNPTDGQPPTIPTNRPIFASGLAIASYTCDDGSVSYFRIAAGSFYGFSQAEADAKANAYVIRNARLNRLCIGSLTKTSGCLNEEFFGTIAASTTAAGVVFTVSSGQLPLGTSLVRVSNYAYAIVGTAFISGDYTFTILAVDSRGTQNSKSFTIRIAGISTVILPNAQQDVPYSEFLQYEGTLPGAASWSIVGGSLPVGMGLNSSTGEISGTPLEAGTVSIIVQLSSGSLICSTDLTLTVESVCVDIFTDMEWNAPIINPGGGSASGTFGPGNTYSFILDVASGDAPPSISSESVAISYEGPAKVVYAVIDVTSCTGTAMSCFGRLLVDGIDVDGFNIPISVGKYIIPITIPECLTPKDVILQSSNAGSGSAETRHFECAVEITTCPTCGADFSALSWDAGTQSNGSVGTPAAGTSSGVVSGSGFTLSATCNGFDSNTSIIPSNSIGDIEFIGQMSYTGDPIVCCMRATFNGTAPSGLDNSGTGYDISITQDGNPILAENGAGTGVVQDLMFDFVIAQSLVPSVIEVIVRVTATAIADSPFDGVQASGVVTLTGSVGTC